ncbi:hypothetical protein [Halorientalis sp.]|jgi:hypothetical protein|uniref:hypothetical protein n=1 Tax=Halorientalis sp. TaxID=1931229 RepID=UPI00262F5128|nr:hypothetical protein [Halorientalis sp.]
MPRLALDLPDELGRVENSRENGESRGEETPVGTPVAVRGRGADDTRVARWHRCWAGFEGQ